MGTIHNCQHSQNGRLRGDGQRSTTLASNRQTDEMNLQLVGRSAKAFIDQIFIGRNYSKRGGVRTASTQLSDPLDILISNRKLFLQSLQLVHQESESIKLFLEAESSEYQAGSSSDSEMVNRSLRNTKQNDKNLSWKRDKDQYTHSSNRISSPHLSDEIVVLRPAQKVMDSRMHVTCTCSSLQSHQSHKSKRQNAKQTYFSFREIKRRLKRALADHQEKLHWISIIGSFYKYPTKKQIISGNDNRETSADFSSRKLANSTTNPKDSNKQDEERIFRSRNRKEISSTDETVRRKAKLSTRRHSKHQESDIFQQAKKHLSERLRNVNESGILEKRQAQKSLLRILSSPEHDLISPSSNMENNFLSSESRFSSYKFSVKDDQKSSGNASKNSETRAITKPEDLSTFEIPSESIKNDLTGTLYSPDTEELCKEYNMDSFTMASPSRDQIARSSFDASPSSLTTYGPEESECGKDAEDHHSPVSVLEPYFTEDAIGSKSIIPAKRQLRPFRIDFDLLMEPKCNTNACIGQEESISAYVRDILQDYCLNCDDPLLTRPSFNRVLKSSSTGLHNDPKLFFDCVNDVLIEVYQQQFGCSPWTSYLNPKIRSFQPKDRLVNEVVKRVKCLLNLQLMQPTLDQIVGQDFTKSASWIDIRVHTEDLVNEIAEDILLQILVDTILMFHT